MLVKGATGDLPDKGTVMRGFVFCVNFLNKLYQQIVGLSMHILIDTPEPSDAYILD